MELYQSQGKSIPQRITLLAGQTVILGVSTWLLFGGEKALNTWFNWNLIRGNGQRQLLLFILFLIVYARITFMVLYLLKRSISWSEAFTIPVAFALYYVGYSLFSLTSLSPLSYWDVLWALLFIFGSWTNTFGEWKRHQWKEDPNNKGKLYTGGLFHFSMHVNYFGDVLWVTALALVSHNPWALFIPLLLICMFIFYNIPMLDKHLQEKYGEDYEEYRRTTKRLIPFIY